MPRKSKAQRAYSRNGAKGRAARAKANVDRETAEVTSSAAPDAVTPLPESPAELPTWGSVLAFLEGERPLSVLRAETVNPAWRTSVHEYFRTIIVDEFPFAAEQVEHGVDWKRKWVILKGLGPEALPVTISETYDQINEEYRFHVQVYLSPPMENPTGWVRTDTSKKRRLGGVFPASLPACPYTDSNAEWLLAANFEQHPLPLPNNCLPHPSEDWDEDEEWLEGYGIEAKFFATRRADRKSSLFYEISTEDFNYIQDETQKDHNRGGSRGTLETGSIGPKTFGKSVIASNSEDEIQSLAAPAIYEMSRLVCNNVDINLSTYRSNDGTCSLTGASLKLVCYMDICPEKRRAWTPYELKVTLESLEFA